MSANPFDYVNDIFYKKSNIIRTSENPEQAEKDYNPYIVNKALSYYIDCIHAANMMNMFNGLDNLMQFDYLINSIRSRKRSKEKWYKKDNDLTDLDVVMSHYGLNFVKAKAALSILTNEQLSLLRKKEEQK